MRPGQPWMAREGEALGDGDGERSGDEGWDRSRAVTCREESREARGEAGCLWKGERSGGVASVHPVPLTWSADLLHSRHGQKRPRAVSRIMRRFLPAFALPLLAACSAAGVLNGITPSSTFDRTKNVSYGDHARAVMDIYRADTPRADAPGLVFVHGGSWSEGDKGIYKFLAEGFTKEGFDVVVPNYRLYPEARYPDMVVDTGRAAAAAARELGRDVVLIGHSAGGYNALMAAMAPDVSGLDVCATVAGLISLAAPTGAYPLTDEPFVTIFPERFGGADAPVNRVEGARLPPVMLVNGLDDTTVGPKNVEVLGDAMEARGLRVERKLYPGMNHVDAVRVLSRHFDGDSPLKGDMIRFIDALDAGRADHCAR